MRQRDRDAPSHTTRRVFAHVVTSSAFAGIERHVAHLAGGQAAAGTPSVVICPPAATELRRALVDAGVRVIPEQGSSRLWVLGAAAALRRTRPRFVCVHDGRGALASSLLSLGTRATLIRTQHFVRPAADHRGVTARRLSLAAHRVVNRRMQGYIAVSQSVLHAAADRGEIGALTQAVIPPAIVLPTDKDVADARAWRQSNPTPTLVFTGRLEIERGLDTLVEALALVRCRRPDCRLVIAGAGTAEPALRRLASQRGLDDAIDWKGWVPDTRVVLGPAHVYVNTWTDEAFGMAMAEAMALGLPIVAPDAGANPEMVESGVTGFLVPAADPVALASSVFTLLDDPALRERLGEIAAERARERFGVERVTSAIERFADLLISTGR